jgi:hypothetical membrane protein
MRTDRRWMLYAALGSAPLFVASLLLFGSQLPGYSHRTDAVSELGGMGVPVGPQFDVFGLLAPGLLGLLAVWEFRRIAASHGLRTRWISVLLAFSLMISLTAVPADFRLKFASPWTWAHAFFVLLNPLLLFVAVPGCARVMKQLGMTPAARWTFIALGYLPLAEFVLYLFMFPGLVQRVMIVSTHLCIAWLGWTLARHRNPTTA